MKLAELNNLSINNIGNWPIPVKAITILVLCLAVLGIGYWYDTQTQLEELQRLEQTESDLKVRYESRQRQANQLDQLKKQLKQIKDTFSELLKQLPSKTEIPALLVDISQTGLASGVEFELFEPKPERKEPDGFYMELPISIRVAGNYHQFGKFISGLANLPRIVTQHDIKIKVDVKGTWTLEETAKTYRYLDEDEMQEASSSKSKTKPAGKKN